MKLALTDSQLNSLFELLLQVIEKKERSNLSGGEERSELWAKKEDGWGAEEKMKTRLVGDE